MIDRDTIKELQAIRTAEMEVAPHVGAVIGMDSAFGVYREALRRLDKDTRGLAGSAAAARAIFANVCKPTRRVAMDTAAAVKSRSVMFPNAHRLNTH